MADTGFHVYKVQVALCHLAMVLYLTVLGSMTDDRAACSG